MKAECLRPALPEQVAHGKGHLMADDVGIAPCAAFGHKAGGGGKFTVRCAHAPQRRVKMFKLEALCGHPVQNRRALFVNQKFGKALGRLSLTEIAVHILQYGVLFFQVDRNIHHILAVFPARQAYGVRLSVLPGRLLYFKL